MTLAVMFIIPACVPGVEPPSDFIIPSASPSEPPVIVVPSGPAMTNIFGVATSNTGSLNPITGTGRLNMEFMPLMYESLFVVDSKFEAVPLLCESYSHVDNVYTLNIRKDVTFWDGTPLTAQDVKYSIELAAGDSSIYSTKMKEITRVTAVSENTLNIELLRNVGRLEVLLDIPIVKKGSGGDFNPVGTGPYLYVEEGDEHYLRADSQWWQGERREPARINLIDSPEADLLINSFETGTISVVGNDPTNTDPVVFGGDYEEWSYPTSSMYYLGLNTVSGPFADVDFRSIITYAVDRSYICEADMLKHADPAVLPINPASALYSRELGSKYSFSLSEFSVLLEERGTYSGTISFVVPADNSYKVSVAERVSEDLRAMGFLVDIRELKWDAYLTALNSKDFDIYIAEVKLTADFNISELISSAGSLNFGGYASEETKALLDAFIGADIKTAKVEAEALYTKLLEDAPIIPILFKRNVVLARRGVLSQIDPVQNNIYYGLKRR